MNARPEWDGVGEPILALVCGLEPARRERQPLLMLQAFIDESETSGQVLVLAGYIAKPAAWAAFSHCWQEILDMRPHWPYAKMSEIAQSQDEARWNRAQALYRVIEDSVAASVCCVVHAGALGQIVDEMRLPGVFRNPYWVGFKTIINGTAQIQERMGFADPIDFIFDDRAEKKRIMAVWDGYVDRLPEPIGKLTGQPPAFRNDQIVKPLQAADFYAWWVRKWWEEDGKVHGEKLRFPWKAKVNFPRLVMECHPDYLRSEMTKIRDQIRALYPSALC